MEITVAPPHPYTGDFARLDAERSEASLHYARWVGADPRMRGRVLDVGCGRDYPGPVHIRDVLQHAAQLDGVDPQPGVADHPGLTERWCDVFENAGIPASTYDALFSFWVAEHVRDPDAFLAQAQRVLRPGGVFYAFTPHAVHPFSIAVRAVQAIRLKRRVKRATIRRETVFPAYYRLNRFGSVVRSARRAGFARAEFHYLPSVHWDHYFPAPLRVLPHVYDRLVGIRLRRAAMILAFRLERE